MRRLILLAAFATLVAAVAFTQVAPTAQATLPAGAGCPAAAGAGTRVYRVSATLEAGANANGVCITLSGTGGTNNTAVLKQNAAGCVGVAVPVVGAGGNVVWADWGTNNCVAPGDTVVIEFKNGAGPVTISTVKWNRVGDVVTDGTPGPNLFGPQAVGGEVERPDVGGLPAESGSSDGSSFPWYTVAAGLAVAAVAAIAAGSYIRRRSQR